MQKKIVHFKVATARSTIKNKKIINIKPKASKQIVQKQIAKKIQILAEKQNTLSMQEKTPMQLSFIKKIDLKDSNNLSLAITPIGVNQVQDQTCLNHLRFDVKNVTQVVQSQNKTIEQDNKINELEEAIAQNYAASEKLKKQFFMRRTHNTKIFKDSKFLISQLKQRTTKIEVLTERNQQKNRLNMSLTYNNLNNKKMNTSQSKFSAFLMQTTNKRTFAVPPRSSYNLYRHEKKQYEPNNDKLNKTLYALEFCPKYQQKLQPFKPIDNLGGQKISLDKQRGNYSSIRTTNQRNHGKMFSLNSLSFDYKTMDSYRNKHKTLNINFIQKNQFNPIKKSNIPYKIEKNGRKQSLMILKKSHSSQFKTESSNNYINFYIPNLTETVPKDKLLNSLKSKYRYENKQNLFQMSR